MQFTRLLNTKLRIKLALNLQGNKYAILIKEHHAVEISIQYVYITKVVVDYTYKCKCNVAIIDRHILYL